MRARPLKLAFLVPAPDFAQEWRWAFDAEAAALVAGGIEVVPVPWTEAKALASYDLILPLVAWGYYERAAEWFGFVERLERERHPVVNPPAVLRWNSDKAYLAELGAKGISTVPTLAVENLQDEHLRQARAAFDAADLVIKPPVSGGAYETFRLAPDDPVPSSVRGRRMIVQPFIEAISTGGEYSLILFDCELSHTVVKLPKQGDFRVQPQFGGVTRVCAAPPSALDLARDALNAAPGQSTYARVDIIRDDSGALRIMELELIEPALFLHLVPEAEARFASAIRSAAERSAEQPLADG